jgi:hypothetical protein
MMLASQVRRPDVTAQDAGPAAGQTVWRIFTWHAGRIVRIQDFAAREDALGALIQT